MKYCAVAVLLFAALHVSAQQMVIHRSGQPDVRISIADITKITFDSLNNATRVTPREAGGKLKAVMAAIFPNPFSTRIQYSLDKAAAVKIRVFDMQGRTVRTLLNSRMDAGSHTTGWNACDDAGKRVSNGSYLVNIEAGGQAISQKLFIVN
jgi:hypothetical protein